MRQLTNINCILNIDTTQKNMIINYLIKKSKSNKLLIFLFESISILVENSINKASVLQALYRIQAKIEKEL